MDFAARWLCFTVIITLIVNVTGVENNKLKSGPIILTSLNEKLAKTMPKFQEHKILKSYICSHTLIITMTTFFDTTDKV